MSDYIVLVVVSIGISVCLSGVIFGCIEADMEFLKSNIRSHWSLISSHADGLDILRARVYDLEQKLKEMETTDDGK